MHKEDELLKYAKEHNVDCVEVSYEYKDNMMQLRNYDVFGLMDFAMKRSIDTVFYEYVKLDKELLKITEDTISHSIYHSDAFALMQNKIEKYNDSVEKQDFEKPITLKGYCIYQGQMISITEEDYYFLEMGFDFPEIKVTNLLSENSDVLESQVAEQKINRQVLREELAQTLLNSDEFKALTNEKVRGNFCRKYIENSENQIYIDAFKHETMGYKVEFLYFIEALYKRYKEDEKKKKIENNNRFMNGDYDILK